MNFRKFPGRIFNKQAEFVGYLLFEARKTEITLRFEMNGSYVEDGIGEQCCMRIEFITRRDSAREAPRISARRGE